MKRIQTMAFSQYLEEVSGTRKLVGSSNSVKFNKARCTVLNNCLEVKEDAAGIIYWMQRDCRVQDNWAMIFAQRMALKAQLPLYVCFFCQPIKAFYPTMRQYKFLIQGLQDVSKELNKLSIQFYCINTTVEESLLNIVNKNNIGGIICEFNPLREHRNIVNELITNLPDDVPLVEVDAHNIVPCKLASDKQEVGARTIRSKIIKKLDEFLVEYPQVYNHEFDSIKLKIQDICLDNVIDVNQHYYKDDPEMKPIIWAVPGYKPAMEMLYTFLTDRLRIYDKKKNEISIDAQSNLSPWLHFGQISSQRCALEAKKVLKDRNVEVFLEELIVRKELTDNFCYYNKNYDTLEGAANWAQETLNLHRKDKRPYLYTQEEFMQCKTHDQIWNAAQKQLATDGKMHGYMRMYWCKKILEWTETPEAAIKIGLYLNDTYNLDGSDPNGFVGVMWSICGVHDQGWKERAIFGKIRYMVDYMLAKKYDTVAYINKHLPNKPIVNIGKVKRTGNNKVLPSKKKKN